MQKVMLVLFGVIVVAFLFNMIEVIIVNTLIGLILMFIFLKLTKKDTSMFRSISCLPISFVIGFAFQVVLGIVGF